MFFSLFSCSVSLLQEIHESIIPLNKTNKSLFLKEHPRVKKFQLKWSLFKGWFVDDLTCVEPIFLHEGKVYLENGHSTEEDFEHKLISLQGNFHLILNFYKKIKPLKFVKFIREIQTFREKSLIVTMESSMSFLIPFDPHEETLSKMEDIFYFSQREKNFSKVIDLRNPQKVLVKF